MNYRILPLTLVSLLLISTTALALGSPWPMFRHDLQHTGRTPYSGPATPIVQWVFQTDDAITSSPSIGEDGTLFVGNGGYHGASSDSCFYAVNPDGSLKWRFPTAGGVFSSPAIGPDGTVYFGSLDFNVYALEDSITYGNVKWTTSLMHWIYSSPAIGEDGTLYIGSLNYNVNALDTNGAVKWSYHTDSCIFSSPAIGSDGAIYVGSKDEHLYALEDDFTEATLRWAHATGEFYDGHCVDSSPAIADDGTIYVGTDPYGSAGNPPVAVETVFFAINPDGSRKWSFDMEDGAESSPAIGPDGTIYVGSYDGNLYAIRDEGDAGVLQWVFPTGGWVDGSPTVDACGTIYFGSRDSNLYALNPDGTLRWVLPLGAEIESSPTIDDQGMLYVGTFAGELYAIGAAGKDVGVVSIDVPEEVPIGSAQVPSATLSNYRAGPASFEISCVIDSLGFSVFADTRYVSDLAETTSIQVDFDPWYVGSEPDVAYTIRVAVSLVDDNNGYNDSLTLPVTAVDLTVVPYDSEHNQENPSPLAQCSPNPFRERAEIRYTVPDDIAGIAPVSLRIFDVMGRTVKTLVQGPMPSGSYRASWNGRDERGRPVASGIYLYRLEVGPLAETQKVVFLR